MPNPRPVEAIEDLRVRNLLSAIFSDQADLVEDLLIQGVNASSRGRYSFNSLGADAVATLRKTHKYIEDIDGDFFFEGSALQTAIQFGTRKVVQLLLEHRADVNDRGPDPNGPLQAAAEFADPSIIKLLLDYGANINAENERGLTALWISARFGRLKAVKLLIGYGAEIDSLNGAESNALHIAARFGHLRIIKLLLERGADVHAQGSNTGTALYEAVEREHLDVAKVLLQGGADANTQSGFYGTALRAAARSGNQEIVTLLLDYGADITLQLQVVNRLSILHLAVESGSFAVLSILCERGGAIHMSTQDETGLTPLHTAVIRANIDMVGYLIDRGASPDEPDYRTIYPLQSAIEMRDGEMSLLIYSKSKVDLPSIAASAWRNCSDREDHRNLEIVGGQERKISFWDDSLRHNLMRMSYPQIELRDPLFSHKGDFMHLHRHAKRAL